MQPQSEPAVEFIILADWAEVINGKLYVMGGGWDRLSVDNFVQPVQLSLAIGVLVPWLATNRLYPIDVCVETADGVMLEPVLNAALSMGRPPDAVPGQPFRALLAVRGTWRLPGPGTYRAVARLKDVDEKRTPFHVYHAASPMLPPSLSAGPLG